MPQTLASLTEELEADINTITRRLALGILIRNIQSSPVDTGRFRSSWVIGVDSSNTDDTRPITSQGGTVADGQNEIFRFNVDRNQSLHLSSNLPYSERLANGYSSQAPAGWIDMNIRAELRELELTLGT